MDNNKNNEFDENEFDDSVFGPEMENSGLTPEMYRQMREEAKRHMNEDNYDEDYNDEDEDDDEGEEDNYPMGMIMGIPFPFQEFANAMVNRKKYFECGICNNQYILKVISIINKNDEAGTIFMECTPNVKQIASTKKENRLEVIDVYILLKQGYFLQFVVGCVSDYVINGNSKDIIINTLVNGKDIKIMIEAPITKNIDAAIPFRSKYESDYISSKKTFMEKLGRDTVFYDITTDRHLSEPLINCGITIFMEESNSSDFSIDTLDLWNIYTKIVYPTIIKISSYFYPDTDSPLDSAAMNTFNPVNTYISVAITNNVLSIWVNLVPNFVLSHLDHRLHYFAYFGNSTYGISTDPLEYPSISFSKIEDKYFDPLIIQCDKFQATEKSQVISIYVKNKGTTRYRNNEYRIFNSEDILLLFDHMFNGLSRWDEPYKYNNKKYSKVYPFYTIPSKDDNSIIKRFMLPYGPISIPYYEEDGEYKFFPFMLIEIDYHKCSKITNTDIIEEMVRSLDTNDQTYIQDLKNTLSNPNLYIRQVWKNDKIVRLLLVCLINIL